MQEGRNFRPSHRCFSPASAPPRLSLIQTREYLEIAPPNFARGEVACLHRGLLYSPPAWRPAPSNLNREIAGNCTLRTPENPQKERKFRSFCTVFSVLHTFTASRRQGAGIWAGGRHRGRRALGPPSRGRCRMPSKSGFWTRKGRPEAAAPLLGPAFPEKRTRDEGRISGSADPEIRYFLGKADPFYLSL